MTVNHTVYQQMLNDREMLPVIATGPAGTGKTYGAVGKAVHWLEDKRKKCLVTRPNVSFSSIARAPSLTPCPLSSSKGLLGTILIF